MNQLNQVEQDFIEFVALKRNRPFGELKKVFLETKNKFNFGKAIYKRLSLEICELFRIFYDDSDEKEVLDSYRFYAPMHLFRLISYSYDFSDDRAPVRNMRYYFRTLFRAVRRGNFSKIFRFIRKTLFTSKGNQKGELVNQQLARPHNIAAFLLKNINDKPTVVDYGCGLGYISFEIGKLAQDAKIYLVDIDSLIFDFVRFRFKKHKIDAEFISVSEENSYPSLPKHNICIAREVMEHLHRPLKVFENIRQNLQEGGLLYGDFSNHENRMFHVSPKLRMLRLEIAKYFKEITPLIFRKR